MQNTQDPGTVFAGTGGEPVAPKSWLLLQALWLTILIVLCYAPVIQNILGQWYKNDDMAHGFFVPLVAGYIIWDKRDALARERAEVNNWGLAVILFGGFLVSLGSVAAEIFTQRVALLVSIYGIVLYLAGARIFRLLLFPLVLLFFMLPIPGVAYKQVTFPLQLLASQLAEHIMELAGFMVLREGNILELAGRQISVVEACSGIRSLFSLTFFSLAYAYVMRSPAWILWVMLAVTIPVAILANASRVALTGILGEYDQQLAEGLFHSFSGWAIFVFGIAILMVIHAAISRFARKRG